MKKYTILLSGILLLFSVISYAQSRQFGRGRKSRSYVYSCAKIYIGFSTGINNASGMAGVQVDIPITGALSINSGVGISTWGVKCAAECRAYLDPCNRGWAFGAGVSYNGGVKYYSATMSTINGDQPVAVREQPKLNVNLSVYRFWNLGHRGSRFYLQSGYSIATKPTEIDQVFGPELTDQGRHSLTRMAPGGIIAVIGFSFTLDRHEPR